MPMDYSYAVGGNEKNPVGRGLYKDQKELVAQGVPSVFDPEQDWDTLSNLLKVVGFGVVPPTFPQRCQYLGEDEEGNFLIKDKQFYQIADQALQCSGFLEGGEQLITQGLGLPAKSAFTIPTEHYQCDLSEDATQRSYPLSLHTVMLDTDKQTIELVYSTAIHVDSTEALHVTLQATSPQAPHAEKGVKYGVS